MALSTLVSAREYQPPVGSLSHPSPLPFPSFQSWDRDPYLFTDPDTKAVTTVKQMDEIARNVIVANYNSLGAVDNGACCAAAALPSHPRPHAATLTSPHSP